MPQTRRYPHSFYLAMAASFLFWASFQWMYVSLPTYVLEIGGNAVHVGLSSALITLSALLARPTLGRLADSWGRKRVLMVGAILFALAPAAFIVAQSLWSFLAVRFVSGFGLAAFTNAYTALIADMVPPERRGEAVGLSGITGHLGMLFAPALGAALLTRWGYGVHFGIASGIGAASFLFLLPVTEPKRAGTAVEGDLSILQVARVRSVWLSTLGTMGLALAYGVAITFLAPWALERGLAAAGGFFTTFALAGMGAQAISGWLSDRVGRRAVALPGMVLAVVCMVVLGLARSNLALLGAGVLMGLSWGLIRASLDTALVEAVPANNRGTALAFFYSSFDIGVGAGAFALGFLAEAMGLGAIFVAAAALALLVWISYAVLGAARAQPTT